MILVILCWSVFDVLVRPKDVNISKDTLSGNIIIILFCPTTILYVSRHRSPTHSLMTFERFIKNTKPYKNWKHTNLWYSPHFFLTFHLLHHKFFLFYIHPHFFEGWTDSKNWILNDKIYLREKYLRLLYRIQTCGQSRYCRNISYPFRFCVVFQPFGPRFVDL